MPSSSLIILLLFVIEGISSTGLFVCKPCNFLCRKEGQTFLMQVMFQGYMLATPASQPIIRAGLRQWGLPAAAASGVGRKPGHSPVNGPIASQRTFFLALRL